MVISKKQTEIGNDNLPLLAVEGFFPLPWMKHERPRVLFYLTLFNETGKLLVSH